MRKPYSEYLPAFLRKLVQRFRYRRKINSVINDRLSKQLVLKNGIPQKDLRYASQRILLSLVETNHYQHLQLLILAKAMQLRGASVKVLICGECLSGCEIKSVKNESDSDPCWKCRFNAHRMLPMFDLDVIRLSDVISDTEMKQFQQEAEEFVLSEKKEISKHGISLQQCIDDSVIRYFYGSVPLDRAKVTIAHTHTALIAAEIAVRMEKQWAPTTVLGSMFCYSAWEPYFRYFDKNGCRFKSISITPFNYNSVTIDSYDLYKSSQRFTQYVAARAGKLSLSAQEKTTLQAFLQNRFSGQSQIFKDWGYFEKGDGKLSADDDIRTKLRISKSKRNIFLFSNIFWDVGLSDTAGLYGDILLWVMDTIELLKGNDDVHLYIKPHPGEVFDSSTSLKGVAQTIKETYPELPCNVTIIEPEVKINTYDLFPFIDIGVIFNGTVGVEMLLNKIPVITTGKTPFQEQGFAYEPATREEYKQAMLGQLSAITLDEERIELFAYFYFIKNLIPWTLTKQAYADKFDGFTIESLDDLAEGKDAYMDHIIKCVLFPGEVTIENWHHTTDRSIEI